MHFKAHFTPCFNHADNLVRCVVGSESFRVRCFHLATSVSSSYSSSRHFSSTYIDKYTCDPTKRG